MPETQEQKKNAGTDFLVGFLLGIIAAVGGVFAGAFLNAILAFFRFSLSAGASLSIFPAAAILSAGGLAGYFFKRGEKVKALGVIVGALTPLLVFGGCVAVLSGFKFGGAR